MIAFYVLSGCALTHIVKLLMVYDSLIDFCQQKKKETEVALRQQVEIPVNGRMAQPDCTGTPGVSAALLRSGKNVCVYVYRAC